MCVGSLGACSDAGSMTTTSDKTDAETTADSVCQFQCLEQSLQLWVNPGNEGVARTRRNS